MNNEFLERELSWCTEVVVSRVKLYFNQECKYANVDEIKEPALDDDTNAYCRFVRKHALSREERLTVIMACVPYLKPELMDCFQVKNNNTGERFSEFGCISNSTNDELVPTLATVLWLIAGDDIEKRLELASELIGSHILRRTQILKSLPGQTDSFSTWRLSLNRELLDLLLLDRPFIPEFSTEFPATRISTNRDWSELVLDDQTMAQVNEIKLWVKYGERIRREWGLESRIKPGYRALFYGPSGSGKTFTATLLGKEVGKDVFCVDLSMVVSKFIGETEKNLSHVFEVAENKDWILFFDEADALFGKRTNVKDSHDRYANQEVAYLLQRVENYRGLIILSTNFKSNIDEAFARRFQVMVPFRMPEPEQRKRLWYDTFSSSVILEKDIDLNFISEEYELSGGSIVNVVQYCSLMAMSRGECIIRKDDIIEGIRKEFAKVGKILN